MDDADVMSLLRAQRHSFLNHLQVVSGWLQMNQPQRAYDYLLKIVPALVDQGLVTGQVPPAVGHRLIATFLEAEVLGIRLHVTVAEPPDAAVADRLYRSVAESLQAVATLPEAERELSVHISSTTVRYVAGKPVTWQDGSVADSREEFLL